MPWWGKRGSAVMIVGTIAPLPLVLSFALTSQPLVQPQRLQRASLCSSRHMSNVDGADAGADPILRTHESLASMVDAVRKAGDAALALQVNQVFN